MERVRLMSWCSSCLTGVHLPAFAAAEAGLFAEQGLAVEFADLAGIPDGTLRGFSTRAKSVADGEFDFALTSAAFLLAAQDEAEGRLGARLPPFRTAETRSRRWWTRTRTCTSRPTCRAHAPRAGACGAVFERYAFGDGAPGSMDASRWEATIAYTAAAHGLSAFPGDRLYRPELLEPAVEHAPA